MCFYNLFVCLIACMCYMYVFVRIHATFTHVYMYIYIWVCINFLCCFADVIMDMLGVPKLRKVILDFYVVSFITLFGT